MYNRVEIVELLIARGANVYTKDYKGNSIFTILQHPDYKFPEMKTVIRNAMILRAPCTIL